MKLTNVTRNHKGSKSNAKSASKSKKPASNKNEGPSDKISISYLPQSPGILPDSTKAFDGDIKAGPSDSRLRVSVPRHFPTAEPDANGNFHFTQDDPKFDAANTYAVARQTLEISQKYAGREIPWSFTESLDREEMLIHPHAGANTANAFYSSDAGSVNFFSYQDGDRNIRRTGMQPDVIAHEVGHAVLDAIRPSYIRAFNVPSGGYHESFGDMLSFIRALHEPDVVDQLKAETKGDLGKSNIASRLAEELGQTLIGTPSLRDAINDHKFADQHFLSYTGNKKDGANSFGTEPHAYANLFTGAFYDAFQATYEQAAADPDLTFHQAIAKARDTMGHLLFRATELAPMGNPAYPEMAQAFIQADMLDNEGANTENLVKVFTKRKILSSRHLEETSAKLADVPKVRLRKAAMKEKGAIEFLADKREALGLPEGVDFEFENAFKNDKGETYLNFTTSKLGELDDPDFGTNEGSRFKALGGLTLLFDAKGKLMANNYDAVTDREMGNIKDHIRERAMANQFIAFNGNNAGHQHAHDGECNHGHNQSLMFTVTTDGSGPVLGKAPVVYC